LAKGSAGKKSPLAPDTKDSIFIRQLIGGFGNALIQIRKISLPNPA
jgi:hypothetical protein